MFPPALVYGSLVTTAAFLKSLKEHLSPPLSFEHFFFKFSYIFHAKVNLAVPAKPRTTVPDNKKEWLLRAKHCAVVNKPSAKTVKLGFPQSFPVSPQSFGSL